MARINLLPWREERRQERQRQFMMSLVVAAIVGVVLVFIGGAVYDQKVRHQEMRNELVRGEIRRLDTRIRRIDELERTRARLVTRKQIIEQLQASRFMTVELLDKLAKSVPAGVTLGTVGQQGMNLAITGNSQSNARVSAYLQELEGNDLFIDPQLEFVRSSNIPSASIEPYQFSIKVKLRAPGADDTEPDLDGPGDQGGTG